MLQSKYYTTNMLLVVAITCAVITLLCQQQQQQQHTIQCYVSAFTVQKIQPIGIWQQKLQQQDQQQQQQLSAVRISRTVDTISTRRRNGGSSSIERKQQHQKSSSSSIVSKHSTSSYTSSKNFFFGGGGVDVIQVSSSLSLMSPLQSQSSLSSSSSTVFRKGSSNTINNGNSALYMSTFRGGAGKASRTTPDGIPLLNDWKILTNGRVVGTIRNHPTIPDGDIITTSPITRPEIANEQKIVTTVSGSKYKLGTLAKKVINNNTKSKNNNNNSNSKSASTTTTDISIAELQKRSRIVFDLTKDVVGDDTRQYLLTTKSSKSTSGKSVIYKAYRSDDDGIPTGDAVTVKMSSNWEAIEREADNYSKITKTGFLRGQFTELIDYIPNASILTKKFKGQSALILERGTTDLKRYITINGKLTGPELREAAAAAAQCIQAIHASGLVWTDMKSENFVVTDDGKFKGIDLESAMPVKDNPVDYSPEGTPPEFATAFLAGDGPYFILNYSYDIWSLGMLFYELSTGKGYFDGKTPVQITKALRNIPDIDLRTIPDPTFRNLVGKCLQIDPKKRWNIFQILLHPYFFQSGIGPITFG